MLNNEPNLQEVGDLKGARDKVDADLVKYVVGESIFTGNFNLKVGSRHVCTRMHLF